MISKTMCLVGLAWTVAAIGCGQQPSRITGTVLLDGRPHDGVAVYFYMDGSEGFATVPTNEQGAYDLNIIDAPVPAGRYKAVIVDPSCASDLLLARQGIAANTGRTPVRYCMPENSPLAVDLRPGGNQLPPLELTK